VKTVQVFVDGKEYQVPAGTTVFRACEAAGLEIPRFCYHDRLSIAGNCRMCLVEVEKTPKPVASCAMPVMPGMKIKTNTPMVIKARKGVMEFLLINHPLDCPICDQGGECDLQDEYMAFSGAPGRYREVKRGVEDKDIGPLVKTVMTRCIHCTRCVRFSSEIAGTEDLGVTGRGNGMEIGTYVSKPFDSELSGNVIDICPVGALTNKPTAFRFRPWELTPFESIDVLDAVGSNIRIDMRGADIMRILPRLHDDINEEWISDKSRWSVDGLRRQRLDAPMMKNADGQLVSCSWVDALQDIKKHVQGVKGNQLLAVAGDMADAESLVALKDLFNRLGCNNFTTDSGVELSADLRSEYLFNSTIAGIESADVVLLVGSNPRMEAAIVCARIRKAVRATNQLVASVGPASTLALPHEELGNDTAILQAIAEEKHEFAETLKSAKKPMVIVGMGALASKDASSVLTAVERLTKNCPNLKTPTWNGVNILHTAASRIAAQDLGFVQGQKTPSQVKVVYLLGADNEHAQSSIPEDAYVIYQGHHGDAGAARADVILPGAAYTEKSGTYVNLEGRAQRTRGVAPTINHAREDWQILRALSEVLDVTLPYSTLEDVRARLVDVSPTFAKINVVETPVFQQSVVIAAEPLGSSPFRPYYDNFFFTNAISRSSKTMADASRQLPSSRNSYVSDSQSLVSVSSDSDDNHAAKQFA